MRRGQDDLGQWEEVKVVLTNEKRSRCVWPIRRGQDYFGQWEEVKRWFRPMRRYKSGFDQDQDEFGQSEEVKIIQANEMRSRWYRSMKSGKNSFDQCKEVKIF